MRPLSPGRRVRSLALQVPSVLHRPQRHADVDLEAWCPSEGLRQVPVCASAARVRRHRDRKGDHQARRAALVEQACDLVADFFRCSNFARHSQV